MPSLADYTPELGAAVAARAAILIPTFEKPAGDYIFGGRRTTPSELGWRFAQTYGAVNPSCILSGEADEQIRATWLDAAGAEHWYRYEKEWD